MSYGPGLRDKAGSKEVQHMDKSLPHVGTQWEVKSSGVKSKWVEEKDLVNNFKRKGDQQLEAGCKK